MSTLLLLFGAAFAVVSGGAFFLLDGGNKSAWARFQAERAGTGRPAGEPPEAAGLPGGDQADFSPEALLGAERTGDANPHQRAQEVLAKGLALGEKAAARGGPAQITDYDGKTAVPLKPRAVPRGPLSYLTLTTVNPASATVAEGNESLGETPLNNVPVLVGKHSFRLLDNRQIPRRLELEFEHGRTLELLKVDVSQLPKWDP
jgi:hypothetical protein